MECSCLEVTTPDEVTDPPSPIYQEYFKWDYECTETTEMVGEPPVEVTVTTCVPAGGMCVDIPDCTAGTDWHPHWAKCAYREPCMEDREHWDDE